MRYSGCKLSWTSDGGLICIGSVIADILYNPANLQMSQNILQNLLQNN